MNLLTIRTCITAVGLAAASTTSVFGQGGVVLLRGHDELLINGQSRSIARLTSLAAGDRAVGVTLELDHLFGPTALWGSLDLASPGLPLRWPDSSEPTDPTPMVAQFDPSMGVHAAGGFAWSALVSNRPGNVLTDAPGFLDSIWYELPGTDAVPLTLSGGSTPVASGLGYWTAASETKSTRVGPFWKAGVSGTKGGLTTGVAIYRSDSGAVSHVLASGAPVGSRLNLAPEFGIGAWGVSPSGSQVVAVVNEAASEEPAGAVVRVATQDASEAAVLLAQGDDVLQIPGRRWRRFYLPLASDRAVCGGLGDWACGADMAAPDDRDSAFLVNGAIQLREGWTVGDGYRLTGPPLAAAMNASGDTAVVWAASAPSGLTGTLLLFNGQPAMRVGDVVDDDGVSRTVSHVQPMVSVGAADAATGLSPVLAFAEIDIASDRVQCLVRIDLPGLPLSTCNPDLTGDGNADQDDVMLLIDILSGGPNPGMINPDFNCDGNTDQDDVAALIATIASGQCP